MLASVHRCWERALLLLVTSFFYTSVTAFGTGAGSCVGGEPAVGAPHLTSDLVYQGSLRELTYDLYINGESVLRGGEDALPLMETNVDYLIEVRGSLARFRGALIRVEVAGDVLVELTPHENAGVAAVCESFDGVVGVTHTDAGVKKSLSGILRVSDPTDNLSLDVTVVGSNDEDYSMFGYNGVTLTVVDVADLGAPVATTLSPTTSPTVIANDETEKPTAGPTVRKTTAPTVGPTASPTATATVAPVTATPTQAPSVAPVTTVPTLGPSMAATGMPTVKAPTIEESTPTSLPAATSPQGTASPVDIEDSAGTTLRTHTIESLQLGFTDVIELSVDERFQWEELTTKWFEQYFAQTAAASAPTSSIVPGSMTTVIHAQSSFVDESTDSFTYIVEYDQELTYRTNDASDGQLEDPFLLATMPFLNESDKSEYLASLVEELWFFRDASSVIGPTSMSVDSDDSGTDRISDSGIIWIVVVLFVVVFCGGFIWSQVSSHMKSNTQDNFPDTFSFMGSMGGSKRFSADAMSLRSYGTTKEASKKYVVYAPSGKLLLVLEVEDNGSAPTVKSIQEDSPLLGKIDVGDYLVAVDEVDVRGKSATKVSKLIANRRSNPVRKLTLIRGEIVSDENESVVAESIGEEDDSVQEDNNASFDLSEDDEDFLGGRSAL